MKADSLIPTFRPDASLPDGTTDKTISPALELEAQEHCRSLPRNFLHPPKAAERSGVLLRQGLTSCRVFPRLRDGSSTIRFQSIRRGRTRPTVLPAITRRPTLPLSDKP